MTKKISFEDACILNAVRFLRFLARLAPLSAAVAAGRFFGLAAYGLSKRRHIARRNLRAAFADTLTPPAIRRLARRSFQNLGAGFGEMLKIPDMDSHYVEKHLTIKGREVFEGHAAKGQGAILLTAHLGSWELLNIAAGLVGRPITVLARVQKHPRSDEFLNKLRASKGSTVIFKGMMLRQLVRALRQGGVVGMLIDQDGGRNGTFVNLFGRRSSTPAGAAQFALSASTPIFCAFIRRVGSLNHEIEIQGPLEMPPADWEDSARHQFLLQQFTDQLEKAIRTAPEQWLWAHRRWKSTPDRWVVVLSDDKPGHAKQSEAVVNSIRAERAAAGFSEDSLHVRTVPLSWRSRRRLTILKAFGWLTGRSSETLLKWALEPDSAKRLFSSYADIIVSCGSSLLDAHLWLKHENGARSIVVMKPHRASDQFEVILAPKHDRLPEAPNLFRMNGALASADPEVIRRRTQELIADLSLHPDTPLISLYLGGDAENFRYEPKKLERILRDARTTAEKIGAGLLVTTSRRTPQWAEEMAKQELGSSPALKLLVIANAQNRAGLMEAMVGVSAAHWVSAESVSMISEVLAAKRPVWFFISGDAAGMKRKHLAFIDGLMRDGLVRKWGESAEQMTVDVGEALKTISARPVFSRSGDGVPSDALRRVLA